LLRSALHSSNVLGGLSARLYIKESLMKIAKNDIPEIFNVPGAVVRQVTGFGDATGYSKIAGEYFSVAAGTDLAPLLKGLEHDLCQSPHWGYLIRGEVNVTYTDGSRETVNDSDLFYWPAGHTVAVSQDAEIILFSPQEEHCAVLAHLKKQLVG
jgi:hypothetical protein